MNNHLNIFKTYTNSFRDFQLENDLTRALAITIQEDSLFFHELLKEVFANTNFYNQLFDSLESETSIFIDIQQKTSQITDFEHIFAITLSETQIGNFWKSENNRNYDPICDLVIRINNVYLIIEAKRDNIDCTSQLYNQILNIVINNDDTKITTLNKKKHENIVTPFDLNWGKLMRTAVRVLSFEKSYGNPNRFLNDFISLVKDHNQSWLPEVPINSLQSDNKKSILKRIESAIIEASKSNPNITKLHYNDRLGIAFSLGWAQEILFDINEIGDLIALICPGNTKHQGKHLFSINPSFSKTIKLLNEDYLVSKTYHIKFTSFQKYFTGLSFNEDKLKNELYTLENFYQFTGRKKRGKDWKDIEALLENCLKYDWKDDCVWNERIINSGRTQFDISFGYIMNVKIPFEKLKKIDTKQTDLNQLTRLIEEVYQQFSNNLVNSNNSLR